LSRNEIRTESADYHFKNGSSATILKTERIQEEKANPYFFFAAIFFSFFIVSYCLVQLINSEKGSYQNEIQIRQVYRIR
ncbi:hypothetical protein, partial [Aetokthonos hydrillicola]|uniref:hypothetical protein n=1 Tax=Aetokthonos hydrillicola TaxID=1550245 RepID=UPI001ABBA18C